MKPAIYYVEETFNFYPEKATEYPFVVFHGSEDGWMEEDCAEFFSDKKEAEQFAKESNAQRKNTEKTIVIAIDSQNIIWGAGLDTESALIEAKQYADNTDGLQLRFVKTKLPLCHIDSDSMKNGECYE